MFCNPAFLLTLSSSLYCFSASAAPKKTPEYVPADPTNVTTIYSAGGVQIRYKEPEICETTSGVRSYSGYVDLDADTHIFFWFFEARNNPSTAPTTLWLTGGPGDDSLLATFLGISMTIFLEMDP
jgi:carboxypeptidase C (cathepsin A)